MGQNRWGRKPTRTDGVSRDSTAPSGVRIRSDQRGGVPPRRGISLRGVGHHTQILFDG